MRHALRLLGLLLVAFVALQLWFVARIALMAAVDPQSTAFERSEIWRLVRTQGRVAWGQRWVSDARLGTTLKRAVIASEDSTFADHGGVDWDAMERAWERNQKAQEQAERRNERAARQAAAGPARAAAPVTPKLVGGSTITQQLAKNLFLSGERTPWRKGQELLLTYALEACLSKQRILEIYLNHVEWGEGLFGAHAAARYYFRTDAERLSAWQAARLAVMLPAPKRFEKRMNSAWLSDRASTIAARMPAVELP